MSDEKVELVRRRFREFAESGGRLDPDSWHEDGVLTGPPGWPERGPFRGTTAIVRQFRRLTEDFPDFDVSNIEAIAETDDWVVVSFRWNTRGAQSGIEASWEMTAALRVKDGRFIEGHYRWDREQALEAAGLSE